MRSECASGSQGTAAHGSRDSPMALDGLATHRGSQCITLFKRTIPAVGKMHGGEGRKLSREAVMRQNCSS